MPDPLETPFDFARFQAGRRPAPAPASAVPAAPPALTPLGTLPLPPGTVLDPLPHERAVLDRLGWQPGDPLPGNLPEVLQGLRREAGQTAGLLPVPPDQPPLEVHTVEFETLTPDQQGRLRQAMAELQRSAAQLAAAQAQAVPGADPSINAALQLAQATAPPPAPAPAPAPAPPVGLPAGQVLAGPPRGAPLVMPSLAEMAQVSRPAPPPAPEPAPAPAPAEAGNAAGAPALTHCPHCGWATARADDTVVEDADKYAYLALVLACDPAVRFRRSVPLFGGAIVVTFRTLTVDEAELVQQQAGDDVKAGTIGSGGEYLAACQAYRLVQSLESVHFRDRGLVTVPAATAVPATAGQRTALPDLQAWLNAQVLPAEMVRLAVEAEFHRFQRLVEKLEANAGNPSFWPGIGPQP